VTYAAEETRHPERTIPRALMLGVALVVAVYLALNAAYLLVLPSERVLASTHIAYDATMAAAGARAASAISLLVIVSSLGGMSGIILAGPRVYYAMAQDGLLFKWIGTVHATYRTPHRAIVAQAIWSSVLVLTGTYGAIVSRVIYTEWIFFGALAVGTIALRRSRGPLSGLKPDSSFRSDSDQWAESGPSRAKRGEQTEQPAKGVNDASSEPLAGDAAAFRAWGFPVTPLLFALMCAAIVVSQLVSDPRNSLWGLGLVVAGLPVYYVWRYLNGRDRFPQPLLPAEIHARAAVGGEPRQGDR
jgi:basic amino acid/polyamine antiporter, APA family